MPGIEEVKEKWFKVSWFQWRGASYVKAENEEQAVKKAESGEDINYEEESGFYEHAEYPVEVEDEEEIEELEEDLEKAFGQVK